MLPMSILRRAAVPNYATSNAHEPLPNRFPNAMRAALRRRHAGRRRFQKHSSGGSAASANPASARRPCGGRPARRRRRSAEEVGRVKHLPQVQRAELGHGRDGGRRVARLRRGARVSHRARTRGGARQHARRRRGQARPRANSAPRSHVLSADAAQDGRCNSHAGGTATRMRGMSGAGIHAAAAHRGPGARLQLVGELLQQRPRVQLHERLAQQPVHLVHRARVRPERVVHARKRQPWQPPRESDTHCMTACLAEAM